MCPSHGPAMLTALDRLTGAGLDQRWRGLHPSSREDFQAEAVGRFWQQALGGGRGGSVGQSLKGPLVSSLLHSCADKRRFHRQGVSLPDFITHQGSPVGVSWLLVRSWCSHGCGPVQALVGDQGIMK